MHRPVLDGMRDADKNDTAPGVEETCPEIIMILENMVSGAAVGLEAHCRKSPERRGWVS